MQPGFTPLKVKQCVLQTGPRKLEYLLSQCKNVLTMDGPLIKPSQKNDMTVKEELMQNPNKTKSAVDANVLLRFYASLRGPKTRKKLAKDDVGVSLRFGNMGMSICLSSSSMSSGLFCPAKAVEKSV